MTTLTRPFIYGLVEIIFISLGNVFCNFLVIVARKDFSSVSVIAIAFGNVTSKRIVFVLV